MAALETKSPHDSDTDDPLKNPANKDWAEKTEAKVLRAAEQKPAETNDDDKEPETPFSFKDKAEKGLLSGRIGSLLGRGRSTKYKAAAAGTLVGSGIIGTVLIALLIVSLIGPWQNVHYSTILRSIGLARFGYMIKKINSRVIFDAAVLTDSSKGHFDLKDRSLVDRLRRVNPEKALTKLGREGTLQFQFDQKSTWGGLKKTSDFKGVVIDGKTISLSDYTKGRKYDDLSAREKLFVKQQFADATKAGLSDKLSVESRAFRSSTYNGLRQATGIRMTKWADKGRKYFGKEPAEAKKLNYEETAKNVKGESPRPKSASSEIDREAEEYRKQVEEAAKQGKSPGKVRSQVAERVKTLGKVSDGVFVVTAACIVHDLANSFEEMDKQNEAKALRLGHDALTAGDQSRSGEVAPEAVGAENARWNGADKAVLYRQDLGDTTLSTRQLADVPSIKGSSQFRDAITFTDQALLTGVSGNILSALGINVEKSIKDVGCNVVLNQYVQYTIAGTEIVITIASAGTVRGITAGLKAGISTAMKVAGTVGLGELLGMLIEDSIKSYAGMGFSGYEQGENLYNSARVGVDELQQTGTRQVIFGAPMDDSDVRQSQQVAMAEIRAENSKQSFSKRYFALDNPFSLASRMAVNIPVTGTSLAEKIKGGFASLTNIFSPQAFGQLSHVLLGNRASAATVSSVNGSLFGVDQWGYTTQEEQRIDSDPAFSLDSLTRDVEPRLTELTEKYMPCYSYWVQSERPEECTKAFLTTTEALQWRWYMALGCAADMQASDTLSDEGCPVGGNPTQETVEESSGTGNYSGDSKALAAQVLANKRITYMPITRFGQPAKMDLEATRDGRALSACGVQALHPTLLKMLLKAAEKYTIQISVFVTKHDCDRGQHPRGKAVDIDSINGINARGDSINGANPALSRRFLVDVGNIMHELMPSGGGGIGQRGCPAFSGLTFPQGIQFFTDACNHLHLDVRGAP